MEDFPKIIMQTWKNSEVPDKWKESPEALKSLMPDWHYCLMTDEMNRIFVKEYFPDFLSTYDNFSHPIQRADAIRYMWLYIHGGIYIDLDIVITKPLDIFFTSSHCDVYLVKSGNVGSYYTNAFMASRPKSPFWLDCIEEMKKEPSPLWVGRHLHVMNTTGPMMLTRVARKSDIVIGELPVKLLVPCSLCDLPCNYSPEAYAYAIPGSSWITWDTLIYNFFFCHWRKILAFFLFMLFLVILLFLAWWLKPCNL